MVGAEIVECIQCYVCTCTTGTCTGYTYYCTSTSTYCTYVDCSTCIVEHNKIRYTCTYIPHVNKCIMYVTCYIHTFMCAHVPVINCLKCHKCHLQYFVVGSWYSWLVRLTADFKLFSFYLVSSSTVFLVSR